MKYGKLAYLFLITFGFLTLTSCNWDPQGISEPWLTEETKEPCNGDPELCDKAYDQVVYPTTHNSYNYEFGVTQFFQPNQQHPVRRQLLDGIRGLMLDMSEFEGEVVVMHRNEDIIALLTEQIYASFMGYEPATRPLGDVKNFLDENPREVVTIILESRLDGPTLETTFNAAGLTDYTYAHPGGDWPTLEEMIESNRRLVVFTDNENAAGNPAWLNYVWDHSFETDFDVTDPNDFNCSVNRGDINHNFFILNHWVRPLLGGGDPDAAAEVNEMTFLMDRSMECWQNTNHKPNFVTVDFYEFGHLFEVCDSLNHME